MSNIDERNIDYTTSNRADDDRIDIISVLLDMGKGIRKFWLLLLLFAVACAGVFCAYNKLTYKPLYRAYVTFSVGGEAEENNGYAKIDSDELKETLPHILQSQVLQDMIVDDLQLDWFNFDLSLESQENVDLYTLKVSGDNPADVHNVLNAAMNDIPVIGRYVFGSITFETLDESGVPSTPYNYIPLRKMILEGFAVGLGIDFLLVLIYAFTYETIRREDDLKKHLNVRCLASIPAVRFKRRNKKIDQNIHIFNPFVSYQFSEAFRTISGRIDRESQKYGRKSFLVTSSIPGEGKSTVAINLGMALAKRNKKVVVIDCDFRNPSTANVIGLNEMDMPNVLDAINGKVPISDVIQHYEEWNLDIIYTGTVVNNPISEINAADLKEFIEKVREEYDYVILDTPPAAMLTDASNFAQFVDGIVYVVRYDAVRIRQIREGMNAIAMSRKPILGCVINGAESSEIAYHKYYYGK
ncbi:MAG: polysaccharide biosynthesis tyrosine autokinase [Lachnospiraceae bacterium]|nr:polysaccharide biosynthesis tyrosine autokinase [Lachnospiraceae bacterium]